MGNIRLPKTCTAGSLPQCRIVLAMVPQFTYVLCPTFTTDHTPCTVDTECAPQLNKVPGPYHVHAVCCTCSTCKWAAYACCTQACAGNVLQQTSPHTVLIFIILTPSCQQSAALLLQCRKFPVLPHAAFITHNPRSTKSVPHSSRKCPLLTTGESMRTLECCNWVAYACLCTP